MGTGTEKAEPQKPRIRRERTAIHRYQCSRPVALALSDGLISGETTFFDFGCGRGSDVRLLKARHIVADGWDPYHRPKTSHRPADVVNLGYVLNVIEDVTERSEVLRRAYELAQQVLIVAVRVDRMPEGTVVFGDGQVTCANTFQKIYAQSEFREYLESALGRRAHIAALGVAYVFRSEEIEARYLANCAFTRRLEYRTDLIAEFARNSVAKRYVKLANQLGRAPSAREFPSYEKLLEAFGSAQRIERLLLHHIDESAFEGSRAQRREDILTYLAMMRLQGMRPPALSSLPPTVQLDIKAQWSSYSMALAEGERFLFSMGQPETVRAACAATPIGKHLPTDLYVHRSAEDDLPALLRVLIFAARRVVGELDCDLVKLSTDGRAISFLSYDDFDGDAHPALRRSIRVYLPRASYEIREYGASENPPILHRKETFVAPSYPCYAMFKQLTDAEDALDLLSAPDIGTRQRWAAVLSARGVRIDGHELRPIDGQG
jgi:DNA phosphorothioation-associated putative methyltransferase